VEKGKKGLATAQVIPISHSKNADTKLKTAACLVAKQDASESLNAIELFVI
jgi:hypothetical protein